MKENIATKLVLAVALLAAVSFAVWTGLAASVETPVEATHAGAFSTPF